MESLLQKGFALNFLLFSEVKAQKLNKKQALFTLPPPKLPDSSVQSVLEPLLPSNFLLFKGRNFPYIRNKAPHLILPSLIDLDTVWSVNPRILKQRCSSSLCQVFDFFSCMYGSVDA